MIQIRSNTNGRCVLLMPAIVLRVSFKRVLGKPWTAKKLANFMSQSFQTLEPKEFLRDFVELQSWGSQGEAQKQNLQIWENRLLASFAFGIHGEIKIGLVDSLYPDCYEFWICSSKVVDCIKGRRWVVKKLPGIRDGTFKKVENDFLFLEGGTEIDREKMFWNYVIKNGLNIGLLVNFIVLLSSSIYGYFSVGNLDLGLPLFVLLIWFISFSFTTIYYRRKVMYIVKEE